MMSHRLPITVVFAAVRTVPARAKRSWVNQPAREAAPARGEDAVSAWCDRPPWHAFSSAVASA